MSTDEVERTLRQNVGRAVRVKTVNGHPSVVEVLNVDLEGFSYRIVEDSDWYPGLEIWSQYDEFAEVAPANDMQAES